MDFFNSAVDVLQTLVIALGAGLGIWGGINLMEGYGNDNPGAKSQGMKQIMAGGGQSFIDSAARFGVDAFITGEVSEQTIHSAREQGLHFYAAGHHATERGGIRALSEWLNENTDLDVTFIDIPNPA